MTEEEENWVRYIDPDQFLTIRGLAKRHGFRYTHLVRLRDISKNFPKAHEVECGYGEKHIVYNHREFELWRRRAKDEATLYRDLPIHRTEAGYPNCSTCDGGGCYDCTDPA